MKSLVRWIRKSFEYGAKRTAFNFLENLPTADFRARYLIHRARSGVRPYRFPPILIRRATPAPLLPP